MSPHVYIVLNEYQNKSDDELIYKVMNLSIYKNVEEILRAIQYQCLTEVPKQDTYNGKWYLVEDINGVENRILENYFGSWEPKNADTDEVLQDDPPITHEEEKIFQNSYLKVKRFEN